MTEKRGLPLVKPRRPFHLPPNRVHKDKKDLIAKPRHKGKSADSEARY